MTFGFDSTLTSREPSQKHYRKVVVTSSAATESLNKPCLQACHQMQAPYATGPLRCLSKAVIADGLPAITERRQ